MENEPRYFSKMYVDELQKRIEKLMDLLRQGRDLAWKSTGSDEYMTRALDWMRRVDEVIGGKP